MTVGKKIAGSLAMTLVALVAIGLLALWSTARLIEASGWVTHTHDVLTQLEALLSVMKDAETGR